MKLYEVPNDNGFYAIVMAENEEEAIDRLAEHCRNGYTKTDNKEQIIKRCLHIPLDKPLMIEEVENGIHIGSNDC